MKILMTGGTGFVGSYLSRRLAEEGHDITVLTRGEPKGKGAPVGMKLLQGDPTQRGPWRDAVAQQDALINLAGASIFGRWTPERKQLLRDSRILTTRNLVEAIPPETEMLLFSTSAVGYYGFHGDEKLDESSPAGEDFLAHLSLEWEAEAMKAQEKGARVVITRFGIVLGRDGGALRQMVRPFRLFAGGPLGSGLQWISWIHMSDLVEAFVYFLSRPEMSASFNLTAPNPVQNRDFARTLGKVLGRPSWIPAPAFMVKAVMGEFGSVILKGQRVLPRKLEESGFSFRFPQIEEALRNLLG